MNDKIVALIINQEYNSTRLTIRTSNVDAREVGAMFSDNPKGKYNATTVWDRFMFMAVPLCNLNPATKS